MIIDITGAVLLPGKQGRDCPGNGMNTNVECCCDECDYLLCCIYGENLTQCDVCKDYNCPRVVKRHTERSINEN